MTPQRRSSVLTTCSTASGSVGLAPAAFAGPAHERPAAGIGHGEQRQASGGGGRRGRDEIGRAGCSAPAARAGRRSCRSSPCPSATSSASASSASDGEHAGGVRDFVEERRAVGLDELHDGPGARAQLGGIGRFARTPTRSADRRARQQRDRRRADGRGASLRLQRARRPSRVHTKRPARQCSSSHSGSYSEMREGRMSVSHALAGASNPSSCDSTAASASGALHARIRQHPLPLEQKAHEIPRRHRLDLRPQALDRIAVDAREQAPLAPLLLAAARGEPAAQREPLALQRRERRMDPAQAARRPIRQCARARDRPRALEAAAHDLGHAPRRSRAPAARTSARRSAATHSCRPSGAPIVATRPCAASSLHERRPGGVRAATPRSSERSARAAHRAAHRPSPRPATPLRVRARSASPSERPRSAAEAGSIQRRLMTAWVRRSSSGASSR